MPKVSLSKVRPTALVPHIKAFYKAHKFITILIALSIFSAIYGTAKASSSSSATRYILGSVRRGTISTTVSGTGTITASDQVDLKAKASGDIVSLPVKTGDEVAQGALIAAIDSGDAGLSLRSAELSLEKLKEPSDSSTVINARQALQDAKNAEALAYANAFNESASVFLDIPSVIDGMDDLLYSTGGYLSDQSVTALGSTAASYRMNAGVKYDTAKHEYDSLSADFKLANTGTATSTLLSLYGRTQSVLVDFGEALKEAALAVDYVKNINTTSDTSTSRIATTLGTTAQTSLSSWQSKVKSHLDSITSYLNTINTSPYTINSRQAALDKLLQGADPLDIASQEIAVEQRRNAYSNYFVTAPISGTVGRVSVKKGDDVSAGSVVATLVTKGKVAEISLNEVDAAKVKVGDKATLTFDAVEGLSLNGIVSDIDLVGTVTQGVVNYNAKITIDNDDDRVLPGMSVNADIITDEKSDALVVPSSAVKSDRRGSYVLAFDPPLPPTEGGVSTSNVPIEIPIKLGLVNDTESEITQGLSEGEQVVVRSISGTAAATTQQAPSIFGGGSPRGSSGAVRFAR